MPHTSTTQRNPCDCFGVETVRLQTRYVRCILEVHSRRVVVAGCTAHPTAAWVTQQARNVCWELAAAGRRPTVLVRDRDAKFAPAFDAVFAGEGVRVVRTPVRAPRANAFAERWVGTVRRECLDWLLILDAGHLQRVLRGYAEHHNRARPHRGRGLCTRHSAPRRGRVPQGRSAVGIAPVVCSTSMSAWPPECVGFCTSHLRKRAVWVEPLFGEAKQWHGLRRFRLRGLPKVNSQALLTAAGQNLERLLRRRGWGRRPWPGCPAGALRARRRPRTPAHSW
jgi:hypothetical protein